MNKPIDPSELRHRLEVFLERVAHADQRALLLDYDGTLAPFRVQRDKATPYPGLRDALEEIQAAGHTRLVIITGRYTRDLLPLLGMRRPPEIWGSHGWERRFPNGHTEIGRMAPRALQGLAEADDWVETHRLEERREVKPGCLAIHLRGLPAREAAGLKEFILDIWRELAWRNGLDLSEFDGGVELRVPGRTKGDAVRTVLGEMATGAPAAFLGDDRTDEEGFEAISSIDGGLSALVRPEFRPTRASIWLKPPEELLEFLHRWQEAAVHHTVS